MIDRSGPNAQQIEYWNEVTGPKWVRLDATINALIRPFGVEAMESAKPLPGERVIDVGCGCGQTSFALARAVAPDGNVTGVDISDPMLAHAREGCDEEGIENLEFINADAQTQVFTPDAYDLVFSRFGVMFFAEPEAAFANLLRALRPGGRLRFVCWQAREKNPWLAMPAAAAARHFDLPKPPEADAPGPFALCDPDRTVGILERAGFADVGCHSTERKIDVSLGRSIEDTVLFLSQMGPVGAMFGTATDEQKEAALGAIHEVLLPHQTTSGIELGAAAWIVSGVKG